MKLTSRNRNKIDIGSLFQTDKDHQYEVINIWDAQNKKYIWITLKCIKAPRDSWMLGRVIYGRPLSEWYGVEVINQRFEGRQ